MEGGGEKGSTGNPLNLPVFGESSFDSTVSLPEFHNGVEYLKELFRQNCVEPNKAAPCRSCGEVALNLHRISHLIEATRHKVKCQNEGYNTAARGCSVLSPFLLIWFVFPQNYNLGYHLSGLHYH